MLKGKKLKKPLSLFLSFLMLMSLLSGCGGNTNKKDDEDKQNTSKAEYFNKTGMPIVNQPITMSIMGQLDAARGVPFAKNEFFSNMGKMTNIKFEYREVDSSTYKEKLNLVFASGDLPDLFIGGGLDRKTISAQTKQGALIKLNDYIDKYAPNFKGLMSKNVDVRRAVTLPDGTISTFPFCNMEIEPGKGQCPPDALLIYKPWIDKLGLKMPTDTVELYNVLKAFKEKDPNGNGKADEIPLSPRYNAAGLKLLFAMFGVMLNNNNLFLADGVKIVYAPFTNEFKEGLRYFRKLYAEGLIDKDIFVQNTQQVTAKGSGQVDILGATVSSAAFVVVGEARNKEMVFTPIIKAPNGSQMWWNRVYATPGAYAVTNKCKYPEAAVRWADTFYSQEGARYTWMGIENIHYKMNSDGTWDWILKDGENATQLRARGTIQTTIGSPPSLCPSIWFKLNDPVEGIANKQRVKMVEDNPGKLRVACPDFYYAPDMEARINSLATDLNAYFDQMFAKFVIGEASIDNDWAAFEGTLKKMGVEELVSLTQAAYNDYVKN